VLSNLYTKFAQLLLSFWFIFVAKCGIQRKRIRDRPNYAVNISPPYKSSIGAIVRLTVPLVAGLNAEKLWQLRC